jgi:glycosyltransferase involved in cell wall biosynthesis
MGDYKMAEHFVSIVIPSYNRAVTLSYCLDSIVNQTYQNFEIIVVDDGSADNTKDIVLEYKNKCDITYIKQENLGAQAARNRGIFESKYDWIAFQDSDDEWLPNKMEIQMKILSENDFNPYIFLYSQCYVFREDEQKTSLWILPNFSDKETYKNLLIKSAPMFQSLLTSKKALLEIGCLDEEVKSFQEWETSIRLSRICKCVYIDQPLFIYNLHSGETISKDNKKYIEGYIYILNKYKDEIVKYYGFDKYSKEVEKIMQKAIKDGLYEELKSLFQ